MSKPFKPCRAARISDIHNKLEVLMLWLKPCNKIKSAEKDVTKPCHAKKKTTKNQARNLRMKNAHPAY